MGQRKACKQLKKGRSREEIWAFLSCGLATRLGIVGLAHYHEIGSLSSRVFETRTVTGSDLFSLLTCFHATTFILLNIFSPLEIISTKIWETPLSWHAKFSLPVAVRVSKTRVLKLPIIYLESLREGFLKLCNCHYFSFSFL